MTTDATIVAATLRQLAAWSDEDRTADELYQLANEVEAHDFTDSWCCPMCQEVECDDDCPLAALRASAGKDGH